MGIRHVTLTGPGVSTTSGATAVRTVQLGFAGVTTGAWVDATGYPWKRKALDPTADPLALADPAVQPAGVQAYPVGGNTELPAGTEGWFEPSPDGVGWVFTTASSTPGITAVGTNLSPDYAITTSLVWEDVLTISLPAAGLYYLNYLASAHAKVTGGSDFGVIRTQLYDATTPFEMSTTTAVVVRAAAGGGDFYGSVSASFLYLAAGPADIKLRAYRSAVAGTWTNSDLTEKSAPWHGDTSLIATPLPFTYVF